MAAITSVPDYSTPAFTASIPDEDTQAYHCGAEYHLARMSTMAAALHPWAMRLSRKTGWFSASIPNAAKYLNSTPVTIRRAIRDLVEVGFFVVVEQGWDKPTVYKVLNHEDWAKLHPQQCTTKLVSVWNGEGDKVAQHISARTAFTVKLHENQAKQLRSLGLSDEAILEAFDSYRTLHPQQKSKDVIPCFLTNLRRMGIHKLPSRNL